MAVTLLHTSSTHSAVFVTLVVPFITKHVSSVGSLVTAVLQSKIKIGLLLHSRMNSVFLLDG